MYSKNVNNRYSKSSIYGYKVQVVVCLEIGIGEFNDIT